MDLDAGDGLKPGLLSHNEKSKLNVEQCFDYLDIIHCMTELGSFVTQACNMRTQQFLFLGVSASVFISTNQDTLITWERRHRLKTLH